MAVQVLAGFWDLDLESRELLLCPRSRKMFGFPAGRPRKLAGFDWQARIHPDDMLTIDQELGIARRTNELYSARFRAVRPDGSSCEILGVGRAATSDAKRFVGLNFDLHETTAVAERESRSVRSMMTLASALFLQRPGPANENDSRPWRAWSLRPTPATNAKQIRQCPERKILSRRAKAEIARRQVRKVFFNPTMLGEPAFDVLLALYARPSVGMMSLADLSIVVDAPTNISLRWLQFLMSEGLVLLVQIGEEADPNEMTAALADKGRIALDEYFRAAGRII